MKYIQLKGERQFFSVPGFMLHRLKPAVPYTEDLYQKLKPYIIMGYIEVSEIKREEEHYINPVNEIIKEYGITEVNVDSVPNVERVVEEEVNEEVEVEDEKPKKRGRKSKTEEK